MGHMAGACEVEGDQEKVTRAWTWKAFPREQFLGGVKAGVAWREKALCFLRYLFLVLAID